MITHVAVRHQGRIWSLPRPYRHHHIMRTILWLVEEFGEYTKEKAERFASGDDQGFLDDTGKYYTRQEAEVIARQCNQIKNGEIIGGVLTSEDLW